MSFAVAEGRLWFRDGLCVMTVLVHVSLFCLKPLRYQELQNLQYTTNDRMFALPPWHAPREDLPTWSGSRVSGSNLTLETLELLSLAINFNNFSDFELPQVNNFSNFSNFAKIFASARAARN